MQRAALLAAVALWGSTAAAPPPSAALPPPPTTTNCGARVVPPTPAQPPLTMCASVSELPSAGGNVTITWSGNTDPSIKDMIELYYVHHLPANLSAHAPIKASPAAADPDHLRYGRGSVTFALHNLRWPVRAVMTNARWGRLVTRGQAGDVAFADPNAPQQLHSSPGANPSRAVVAWSTRDATDPRVRWGWSEDGAYEGGEAAGTTFTYAAADLCAAPASTVGFSDPGALHRAVIDGIPAGATVHYEVYDGASPNGTRASGVYHAPPLPASPTRVVFKADEGQADPDGTSRGAFWVFPASRNTSAAVAADVARAGARWPALPAHPSPRPDAPPPSSFNATLVLHGGDVSYANGHGPTWDAYMWDNEPTHARAGVVAVAGNHERDAPRSGDRFGNVSDSGGECGVPHYARFVSPGPVADAAWWALDWGSIHFVGWSTEAAFDPASPQHAFLAADLAAVNRSATPFVVAIGHRPMYVDSGYAGGGNASDVAFAADARAALEPLFVARGVDVTLAGHHHSYQRTCPVVAGACAGAGEGPVHVVAGHAGADFTDGAMLDPTPPLFRVVDFRHGYLRLAADADVLTVTSVAAADGGVIDEFSVRVAERRRGGGGTGLAPPAPSPSALGDGGLGRRGGPEAARRTA